MIINFKSNLLFFGFYQLAIIFLQVKANLFEYLYNHLLVKEQLGELHQLVLLVSNASMLHENNKLLALLWVRIFQALF